VDTSTYTESDIQTALGDAIRDAIYWSRQMNSLEAYADANRLSLRASILQELLDARVREGE